MVSPLASCQTQHGPSTITHVNWNKESPSMPLQYTCKRLKYNIFKNYLLIRNSFLEIGDFLVRCGPSFKADMLSDYTLSKTVSLIDPRFPLLSEISAVNVTFSHQFLKRKVKAKALL